MQTKQKTTSIWVVMWLVTMLVAISGFYLCVAEEFRSTKFYVSLLAVLFTTTVSYFLPFFMISRNDNDKDRLPIQLGVSLIVGLYAVCVFALLLLALTSISAKALIALHLLFLLTFVLMVGIKAISGLAIAQTSQTDESVRSSFIEFKRQFGAVCDDLSRIEYDAARAIYAAFRRFKDEDMAYATSESLPGSEAVDAQMKVHLARIEEKVADLALAAENIAAGESDNDQDISVTEIEAKRIIALLNGDFTKIKQTLEQREQLMGQLR